MERIYIFLQAIIIVIIFGACEKVIDVPLEESDKQIVIEAKLHEGIQNFRVDISKTAPYFEDIMPEKIENVLLIQLPSGFISNCLNSIMIFKYIDTKICNFFNKL